MQWHDFSTAPKDGRRFVVYFGRGDWYGHLIFWWDADSGGWQSDLRGGYDERHPPTHWAELTKPSMP